MAIAVGFALVTLVVADAVPGTIALHDPALRMSEFVAGVTVGMGLRRGWVPRISLSAAALVYAVLVVGASITRVPWLVPLPGAALLLAASAGADLRGELAWLTSRWSVYLGEVSFSFYLVHEPLMSYLNAIGVRGWWLVVALPAGLVVAIAVHHGIELPMRRGIMHASSRRETDQRPIGTGVAQSL